MWRRSLKKGAPDVPVMPDPSHFLRDRNVEEPLETTVTVKGRVEDPVDLLVPGCFRVPSTIEGNTAVLKIYLEPGDWTLIRL